ncbi:ECF RNA polymerase sigma factor SigX [Fundidesulfovibrio magnetotacticus]|uniref:ECF RNA polymerase sigma factor SigX n=1 Tax=Fundidesulfovibrio magnetotacticus TaxID=2730080 RepID=A0A6V8LRM1_9BACT|nr:sigma-70 family RNA polymerase sigma factor [Fundidesulfovibrio magnetotacticus]GFK94364.1 ECF RNA polymerase sigma factor SigX [Fundidesulfovibrio magnetotacticus]
MKDISVPARHSDIGRVVAGEKIAWDRFVEDFSGLLYGVVLRTLRLRSPSASADDAKDVMQEVFLRLIKDDFRLLRSYREERASLSTWLTVVGRSVALDWLRRPEARRATVELDEELAAPEDRPFGGRLELPPGVLTERQAHVLTLLFDQDLDVDEVAQALSVQAQTVRSLKHQALERLRGHYGARPDLA